MQWKLVATMQSAVTGEHNQQHWDANAMQSACKREGEREKEAAEKEMRDKAHALVL